VGVARVPGQQPGHRLADRHLLIPQRHLIKILEDVPLPGETRSRTRLWLATVGMFLEATPDAPTASAQP
jgi:hypothetical protein